MLCFACTVNRAVALSTISLYMLSHYIIGHIVVYRTLNATKRPAIHPTRGNLP